MFDERDRVSRVGPSLIKRTDITQLSPDHNPVSQIVKNACIFALVRYDSVGADHGHNPFVIELGR
jgi:hypothetical protein